MAATKLLTILLSIALIAGPAKLSASSRQDLQRQLQRINDDVTFVRSRITERGSSMAKDADVTVDFAAVDSIVPFAFAVPASAGGPRIVISTQYSLLLVYVAELDMLAAKYPELAPCVVEYRTMTAKVLEGNRKRAMAGDQPFDLPAPEAYSRATQADCSGIPRMLPLPETERYFRNSLVTLALAFTYLHELGHVALDHRQPMVDAVFDGTTDESERIKLFLIAARQSRDHEREADAWAAREMLRQGANPAEALPSAWISMLIATSGLDCTARGALSHPDTTARIAALVQVIQREYFAIHRREVPSSVQGLFNDLIAFSDKATKTLECDATDS